MTNDADAYLLDFPGLSRCFAYPSAGCDRPGPALVADVFEAFAPLLRPLALDLLLVAYRGEDQDAVSLRHPFWFIVDAAAQAEMNLTPWTEAVSCREVDAITPTTIEALISNAIGSEELEPDIVATWDQIRVHATELRLPALLADREVLEIAEPGGAFGANVHHRDGAAWVRGGSRGGNPVPVTLTFTGWSLEITTYWSLWAAGGAGVQDLNAAIATLIARGWICRE
jgi:hypothetical protein